MPAESTLDFKETHTYQEWKHSAPLIGCRWDPTGRFVLASAMDHTVQVWDLESDTHRQFAAHEGWLRAMAFSMQGKIAYTAGYDGQVCLWDLSQDAREPLSRWEAHQGWIRAMVTSPSGEYIATGGNDLQVKLWSAETGELVHSFPGHEKHVYSLLFHPNGKYLLSGDLQGVVKVWNVASGKQFKSFDAKPLHTYHGGQQVDYGGVRCMTLNADATELACGGLHKGTNPFAGVQEPLVLVFSWESGEQLRTHEATGIDRGIIWRLHFLEDGTLLGGSGGGTGGFLLFWQQDKPQMHKVKLANTILDLDLHANGRDLVTAHHDGRVRLTRMAAKV